MQTGAKDIYTKAAENETIHHAGQQTTTVFKKAGTFTKETGVKVKDKLDEIGVSQVASNTVEKISTGSKIFGGFLIGKAKETSEAINSNEKIAHAKDVTKEKLGALSGMMASGWNKFYSNVIQYDVEDKDDDKEEGG